jgi:glucokinase
MASRDLAQAELALAIDIGGTKMAAGLVDHGGRLVWRRQVPTPAGDDGEVVWDALAGLVAQAPHRTELCGVGCGGPMEGRGERVSPLNIAGWRGFPLRARLQQLTGAEVHVDNDAKALALAEGWIGGAAGLRHYLSMVVSTGVGGGIVLDGRLLDGGDGNAGHIGHVVVEPDGRPCSCGGRGCLEAEASGTAIAAATGRPAAEAGPEVVRHTGRLVGRAVASVANLLDLQLATVAGSVALGFGAPFFAAATEEIEARCRMEFSAPTRILPSPLGSEAPLVGAAAVGWRGAHRWGPA